MGNGGAKQTNQMLSNQRDIQNQYASSMGDRSAAEYQRRNEQGDYLWNQFANRLGNAPTLTGGHAGTADWYGPAANFYRNMMESGGMTPEQQQGYRSWTTAPIAGFYQGLRSNLDKTNNAIGGFAGYNSQAAKMSRDAARQGFLTAQESESGLQDMLNRNKFAGASGLESSFHKGTPGSAGSAGGVGSQDYYLRQMMDLRNSNEDLPYAQLQGNAINQGYQGATNRRDETPLWQRSLASMIPSAAGAAVGAFMPSGGRVKSPSSYGYGAGGE